MLAKATAFRKNDLSGDEPVIVAYSASYACSSERYAMVRATLQFLKVRHPNLPEGGISKTAAMFIEQQDVRLQSDVIATLSSAPNVH